jgi:hypothetical protein
VRIIPAFLVLLGLLPRLAVADDPRRGLFFGAAAGVASVWTSVEGAPASWQVTPSFPNLKLGYMLTDRVGLALYLPGSLYRYEGTGRARERGFEGVMLSVQAWPVERWWLLAGAGLTLDAPVFYDVKSPDEGHYQAGPGAVVATGYELWRRGSFAFDLQARVHAGRVDVPEGTRRSVAADMLAGVNWY